MINFSEVEKTVRELKQQLADGKIDEKTFEEQLLEMIDVAEDGHYWMFGHNSEQWFRHDGSQWILANPDERLATIVQKPLTKSAAHSSSHPGMNGRNGEQADNDKAIDLGWFIISLIVLALIGGIVYYATLLA